MRLASWTNKGLDWGSTDEVMMLQKRIKIIIEKDTSLTDVIQRFFSTTHEEIWKLLFKAEKTWQETTDDIGLDSAHPATPAPKKKAKKESNEAKGGLRHKGTSDAVFVETKAPCSHEGDEDEEEEEAESDSPLKGRKKKRAASIDPEAEASKRGKISLSDGSDSDAEATPKRHPRAKPLAAFPARDLPQLSSSLGNSLAPEMLESETPP
nr:uncharacterized protein LOC109767039 [Aegilops tauschii subsp. strangulata]